MKRIVFEGYLAEMYPDGIAVEAETAYECIYALRLYDGFREEDGKKYQVTLPDFDSEDALHAKTNLTEIRVVPVYAMAGGRKGSFLMIAVGAVLIASGWGATAGTALISSKAGATIALQIGVSMAINGVIGLLTPQPKLGGAGEADARSAYLPSNRNTTKIGTRIPLLYGRRKVYGHYLSFNVSSTTLEAPTNPVTSLPGGNGGRVDSDYNLIAIP